MATVIAMLLIVASISLHYVNANNRCTRAIQTCRVIDPDTGIASFVQYDNCLQFCCGAGLHDRDVYSACCGDERAGVPYNSRTQICCAWAFGGEFVIYDKANNTNAICCGPELISQDLSCCVSNENRPQAFDSLTAMCCEGVLTEVESTAYTSCCGEVPYDRRIASCPCQDGIIAVGIPDKYALCCYGPLGRTAYNGRTQGCCNGGVYDLATQFCCGNEIGDSATQVCCGNVVAAISPGIEDSGFGCCLLLDGRTIAYDLTTHFCCGNGVGVIGESVCCGNFLTTIPPNLIGVPVECCLPAVGPPVLYDPSANFCCANDVVVIDPDLGDACCGDVVYPSAQSVCCNNAVFAGNECCGGEGFFDIGEICCEGIVFAGDACCGGEGYFNAGEICCEGIVFSHNFTIPACCVDVAFDSYSQTCCGATVYDNPIVINSEGESVVSRHTRCCGDFADASSLLPYDYITQTCCDGIIIDLNGIPWDTAACCGLEVIDLNQDICCDGVRVDIPVGNNNVCCADLSWDAGCCEGLVSVDLDQYSCCDGIRVENIFGIATQCCGTVAIDSTTTLCCDGVVQPSNDGDICCGTFVMNPDEELCCDGVPRSLNGVPRENAICCGDGCIDGSLYWCCDGKQYQKGVSGGADVSGLNCTDLFTA